MKPIIFSKILVIPLLVCCSIAHVSAQKTQKIGDNPYTIDAQAVLELESTTKGFLLPRMSEAQMNLITTPTEGMMVYCTDCGTGSDGELRIAYNSNWQTFKGDVTGDITGNAATVTTNANLTGPITSTGNTTSIGSQTGTGVTFAMSASPSLTGVPTAPTAAAATNTTQLATTAFVTAAASSSNFVDLTTAQTIAGIKSFTSLTTSNGFKVNGVGGFPTIGNQGSYFYWNVPNAGASDGYTSFINQRGTGPGGFKFYNVLSGTMTTANLPIAEIDASGNILANAFVKSGGTSSQYLMADGSVDATSYAPVASPTFTGTPLAPTASAGTNTTQIATTAFVTAAASSSNFVDVTTAQTVAGAKTFSSDLKVNSLTVGLGAGSIITNTAVGKQTLQANTTGTLNTALGSSSLSTNTEGFGNTAIGGNALESNINGLENTAVGYFSLQKNTGSRNTAIGLNAMDQNTTGANNTAVGYVALNANTTGELNTAIGYGADVSLGTLTNATAIGNNAVVANSNTIQLGNTAITNVKTSGTLTAGDVTYTSTDGTTGQLLTTDGSGNTSWVAPAATIREVADEFTATASQTSFTLTQTPSANSKVKMFVNGIRISNTAYNVNGGSLTYNSANNGGNSLTAGDRIQMDYYY